MKHLRGEGDYLFEAELGELPLIRLRNKHTMYLPTWLATTNNTNYLFINSKGVEDTSLKYKNLYTKNVRVFSQFIHSSSTSSK